VKRSPGRGRGFNLTAKPIGNHLAAAGVIGCLLSFTLPVCHSAWRRQAFRPIFGRFLHCKSNHAAKRMIAR